MSPTIGFTTNNSLAQTLRAALTINRIPQTLGYNLAYFAIGIGLAPTPPLDIFKHTGLLITILFFAVMLSKMQASIADALHDQELDAENPDKLFIANSITHIGDEAAYTLLVVEIILGLVLWSWLTHLTNSLLYLICGTAITLFGFLYSYPPRIKERGIFNHITTTTVDVIGVIVPIAILVNASLSREVWMILIAIFAYTFAYHVLHQAGDTYYDRQYGVSTFTQTVGVLRSVQLATVLSFVAGLILLWQEYLVGSIVLLATSGGYWILSRQLKGLSEREQSDYVSKWFNIKWVAILLNGGVAVSLLL